MKIGIYSLKNILYQGEGGSVNCMTESGEITLLDHHRPLISVLRAGTIILTDTKGERHFFSVAGGFLEVQSDNHLRILVNDPSA